MNNNGFLLQFKYSKYQISVHSTRTLHAMSTNTTRRLHAFTARVGAADCSNIQTHFIIYGFKLLEAEIRQIKRTLLVIVYY